MSVSKPTAEDARNARKYRNHLKVLTEEVRLHIAELDRLCKLPSTPDRGRALAKLANDLEMANDKARYFGLGIDYRTDEKGRLVIPHPEPARG